MIPIHYVPYGKEAFCGEWKQPGVVFKSTTHKLAVTCEACQATEAFKRAVQRLPEVEGGPYRGR